MQNYTKSEWVKYLVFEFQFAEFQFWKHNNKAGFQPVNLHEPKKLDKDTRDELTELIEAISLEQFNEYLKSNDKDNVKYDTLNKRISLVNLNKGEDEQLTTYRDIIKWTFEYR